MFSRGAVVPCWQSQLAGNPLPSPFFTLRNHQLHVLDARIFIVAACVSDLQIYGASYSLESSGGYPQLSQQSAGEGRGNDTPAASRGFMLQLQVLTQHSSV
jgi:hypothetical protein